MHYSKLIILLTLLAPFCIAGSDDLKIVEIIALQPDDAPMYVYNTAPAPDISIDQLVTVGKLVWDVVEKGRPVVNLNTDWSAVIPKGVNFDDLEYFTDAKWTGFGWVYKSLLGMENVRFKWNFVFSCKGSYGGKGAFLMHAGTAISELYSAWGYTVSANVTVDNKPINYGSKINPIAGMPIDVNFSVKSVLQSFDNRCSVILKGDCSGVMLAC
jgi:hypothetical protein